MRIWLALALLAVPAVAAEPHLTIAGRDVALWKPQGAAPPAGFPLVVFSHGFLGCNTQSIFLMEAFARAGYLVLAPNHHDARCGTAPAAGFPREEARFSKAKDWTDATYRDRAGDVRAVLDAALAGKSFQGVPVDRTRVALAGHSLGGYTVLGLAGAWPSWKDSRIRAVLALSPYCEPYLNTGDLARLGIPVMYQGGTLDFAITPTVRRRNGAYDASHAPKFYVEFKGAGHLAWTDFNPEFHTIIDRYSVAFFDRYVKGNGRELTALSTSPLPSLVNLLRADPQ